jgi:acyl CoA:acetate/3-ketoacid CoA transferase beta subunit
VAARRTAADDVVARLAAAVVLANVRPRRYLNIGVGLPEEVARALFEGGRLADVTCVVESGVMGGLPAPGIFFGAAVCPQRMVSSAELFALCNARLDAACLGALQADSAGNVNVSKRGTGARGYVGPGGFIDLTTAAETIVFVSAWTAHGDVAVEGESLRIRAVGTAKFVDCVDEITFCGPRAVAAGKRVFYATHVGLFQLTRRGMELIGVMPGVDVERDIVDATAMAVVLPRRGRVPRLPRALFTTAGWSQRAPNWIARAETDDARGWRTESPARINRMRGTRRGTLQDLLSLGSGLAASGIDGQREYRCGILSRPLVLVKPRTLPCASTMRRAIDKPRPEPLGLVVSNKRNTSTDSGMPAPLSLTDMRTA